MASLVPPVLIDESQTYPREFIFVLDRSGSMMGEPIAQARNALRACLRSLNPEDTFRILLFNDHLEWFHNEPIIVTQEHIERADNFLGRVEGRGGTEIVAALEAALSLSADPQRTRFVLFLTDGAVSAEGRALERVRNTIGAARLFTFGIGPSVNRALLNRMAALGRGRASFLQLHDDIEGAVIRFQDSVSFPIVTGLTLEWMHAKPLNLYPVNLPDLYYGQPLEICGRIARSKKGPAVLILRGEQSGQPFELRVTVPETAVQEPAIGRLWAQARVEDLLEQQVLEPDRAEQIHAEVLQLALEFNLLTAYTSFVALDQAETASSAQGRIIHVAQPLPQGLWSNAAMPPMPSSIAQSMPTPMMRITAAQSTMFASSAPPPRARMARDKSTGAISNFTPNDQPEARKTEQPEAALRWLARTQNLDGSWGGSLEMSAVALLAFVRAGHTNKAGTFRQAVRRAVRWVIENPQPGLAGFVRARALQELAEATKHEHDLAAAHAARLITWPAGQQPGASRAGPARPGPSGDRNAG
jgi:Ca-activated chloride channel homolog